MNNKYFFFCLIISFSTFAQQITSKPIEKEELKNFIDNKAKVLKALKFNDKNGVNFFTITLKEERKDDLVSRTLLVQHRIEKNKGDYALLRQVVDYEKECPFDNELDLIDKSLIISDLDKNNLAEISFMYKIGCRSDVSPIDIKLMVIENGNKAAIRGMTSITGINEPKVKTSDLAFKKLPKPIQEQANKIWAKFEHEF